MKRKKENILKSWYKLCEPSKPLWIGQILTFCGYTVLLAIMTILAAKTINYMYEENWTMAFVYLGLELLSIILRQLFYHWEYVFYVRIVAQIKRTVTNKIYDKITNCEDSSLKQMPKEKVLNIAVNNLGHLSEFPDVVAIFVGYSVLVAIALVAIFNANWLAGLVVIGLGVANGFVYTHYNRKMGRIMNERYETKDIMMTSFAKIVDGKPVIEELKQKDTYGQEITEKINNQAKSYGRYYMTYSTRENVYRLVWCTIIYLISAFLLFKVSKNALEMTSYLIVVPYLMTCTEKLNSLFDKSLNLENMRVDVDRVNLILGLKDKEIKKYGDINIKADGYNLGLINVSYNNPDKSSVNYGKLKEIDLSFKMNGVNIIKGERGSGKRLIFNLLRRRIMPTDGVVLLDNLNLYDYNESTFKNHIYYCSSRPTFIKGTIRENLCLMESDFEKVKKLAEYTKIDKLITKYPFGYSTQISDIKSSEHLFAIGLLRAMLSNCKILMVYELPDEVSQSFKNNVRKILTDPILNTKTLILFTHDDRYDDSADIIYTIENGKTKSVKAKTVKEEINSIKPTSKEKTSNKKVDTKTPTKKINTAKTTSESKVLNAKKTKNTNNQ
ncbi:MAG: ABC transporter ATP-binding protein [Clostridia bacterium]|nr:ABC transporter ATP-binding protein [Clostridia bacterium]